MLLQVRRTVLMPRLTSPSGSSRMPGAGAGRLLAGTVDGRPRGLGAGLRAENTAAACKEAIRCDGWQVKKENQRKLRVTKHPRS